MHLVEKYTQKDNTFGSLRDQIVVVFYLHLKDVLYHKHEQTATSAEDEAGTLRDHSKGRLTAFSRKLIHLRLWHE